VIDSVAARVRATPSLVAWLLTLQPTVRRAGGRVPETLPVTPVAQTAWAALGFTPPRAGANRVRRVDIEAAMGRSGLPPNLDEVLAALDPSALIPPRVLRRQALERFETLCAAHPGADAPLSRAWLAQLSSAERHAYGRDTERLACTDQLLNVLAAMPRDGAMTTVPHLAAAVCGNSHALDPDTALGRAWTAALQALYAEPERITGTRSGRVLLLAAFGVAVDLFSSSVLVANLAETREITAARGTGVIIPLDTVQRWRAWPGGAPQTIAVVENPAVFHVLLPYATGPLLCTMGFPSVACQRLLSLAATAGCRALISTDWDAAGYNIAAVAGRSIGERWTPWEKPAVGVTAEPEEQRTAALKASLPNN